MAMTLPSTQPSAGHAATTVNGGASWDWMRPAARMAGPAAEAEFAEYARVATRALSLEPASVGRAREFATATVRRWGMAALAGDLGIVVSELLTNALRHARQDRLSRDGRRAGGWPVRLGLLSGSTCVLCAVADPSAEVPVMREQGDLAETGRGLHVIASLSDGSGWTVPSLDGKVVWALFVPAWRCGAVPAPGPRTAAVS